MFSNPIPGLFEIGFWNPESEFAVNLQFQTSESESPDSRPYLFVCRAPARPAVH